MNKKLLIVLSIGFWGLYSCEKDSSSKESDSNSTPSINVVPCGTIQLKSMHVVNHTWNYTAKKVFSYKSGKIDAMTVTVTNRTTGDSLRHILPYLWSANFDSLLTPLFQTFDKIGVFAGEDSTLFDFSSGHLDRVIYPSISTFSDPSSYSFSYNAQGIPTEISRHEGFHSASHNIKTDGNRNVKKTTVDWNGQWTTNYTFDNHPNPFRCLPIASLLDEPYTFINNNNILIKEEINGSNASLTTNYHYTYNSNGYPSEIIVITDGDTNLVAHLTY